MWIFCQLNSPEQASPPAHPDTKIGWERPAWEARLQGSSGGCSLPGPGHAFNTTVLPHCLGTGPVIGVCRQPPRPRPLTTTRRPSVKLRSCCSLFIHLVLKVQIERAINPHNLVMLLDMQWGRHSLQASELTGLTGGSYRLPTPPAASYLQLSGTPCTTCSSDSTDHLQQHQPPAAAPTTCSSTDHL